MGILIVRPSVNEKEEIIKLFRKTITYAFQQDGLSDRLNDIENENSKSFVMDGGYKKSQIFWINKVGKPTIILKDYWGKDLDHMIWKLNLSSYY